MHTIGPSERLREDVDDMVRVEAMSKADQRAHLEEAMERQERIYGQARNIFRTVTKAIPGRGDKTSTPWIGEYHDPGAEVEPDAEETESYRLKYLLKMVDGTRKVPKLNLYTEAAKTLPSGLVIAQNEFSAVFFRDVQYEVGENFEARGPGVSSYDGRVLNEYGMRYLSPLPAVRDTVTLDAIEATLGLMETRAHDVGLMR